MTSSPAIGVIISVFRNVAMRKSVIFLSNHLTVSDSAKDEFPLIFDHYLDVADDVLSLNFMTTEPNETFIHWNPKLFGLGRQIGQINFGAFGVFLVDLTAPILVLWVPCPCFPLINHYFDKKLSIYISKSQIFIWAWDLNLGRKEPGI